MGTPSTEEYAAATSAIDDVWAVPPESVSWDVTAPHTLEGQVVKQETAVQLDFLTKKPLMWDDGRPRRKVIVTLQTKVDDEDDDGLRQLHVKIPSGLFAAIRDAIKDAKLRTLTPGNWLTITYTGDGKPEKKGMNAPKEFEALITSANQPPA